MDLLGIPVSDDDARHLVATLPVEGTPDALSAAEQITKGVERAPYAVGLSPAEADSRAGAPQGPDRNSGSLPPLPHSRPQSDTTLSGLQRSPSGKPARTGSITATAASPFGKPQTA